MIPAFIAIVVGIAAYLIFSKVFAGRYAANTAHNRHVLSQIMEENENLGVKRSEADEALEILKAELDDSPILKFLSVLPFGKNIVVKIVKAGRQDSATTFIVMILGLILVGLWAISHYALHPGFIVAAFIVPIWLGNKILQSAIEKRRRQFIDMFPDVLDMIVRSVKSGFPINSAFKMVVENMEDPVKSEFRQVSDELALGRPLNEALSRLMTRVDEQDVRFFVVVLKIQQETGGNLAEIVGNLSNIIRKRKQLRQKIRAMTSEGRTTGYILAAIPIVMFGVLLYMSPDHLEPLFNTSSGNIVLAIAGGLVVLSQIIVRKMINIDI